MAQEGTSPMTMQDTMCDGSPLEPFDAWVDTDQDAIDTVYSMPSGFVVRSRESGDYFTRG